MQEQDFPALYRSADDLSLKSQQNFLNALRVHLVTLVVAAILSIVSIPHWSVARYTCFPCVQTDSGTQAEP